MTIQEIYDLAIKKGIQFDFRGEEEVNNHLERIKQKYERMGEEEKEEFDSERLVNPFSDSRILYGDPNKEIKKILVGIDIDGEELLLAEKLENIDLVISHHPRGKALAGLDDVMKLQVDVMHMYGIPINIAEKLIKKRIEEVSRGLSSANHNRAVDMARHLNMPLMCLHTPCDNMAAQFVDKKIKESNPVFLEDIMKCLKEIPEYQEAIKIGAGPEIFVGNKDDRAGKIVITEMTGGTEGSPEIYERLANAGAGTVVGMHISERHREEAQKSHINVIIAGHISSDSIGVNLFLDELEKKGIEIIPCSGLIRVSRA